MKNDLKRRGMAIVFVSMDSNKEYLLREIKLSSKYPPMLPTLDIPLGITNPTDVDHIKTILRKITLNGTNFEYVQQLQDGYYENAYLYRSHKEDIMLLISNQTSILPVYEKTPESEAIRTFGYYRGHGRFSGYDILALSYFPGKKLSDILALCESRIVARDFILAYKNVYDQVYHSNMYVQDIGINNVLFIPARQGNYCSRVVPRLVRFDGVLFLESDQYSDDAITRYDVMQKCQFLEGSMKMQQAFKSNNVILTLDDLKMFDMYNNQWNSLGCGQF
jgi:hypothetical protein